MFLMAQGQEGFLSTPSARRATRSEIDMGNVVSISIHALCEEGDPLIMPAEDIPMPISIHALCEEGDWTIIDILSKIRISIHALCEEGDIAKLHSR